MVGMVYWVVVWLCMRHIDEEKQNTVFLGCLWFYLIKISLNSYKNNARKILRKSFLIEVICCCCSTCNYIETFASCKRPYASSATTVILDVVHAGALIFEACIFLMPLASLAFFQKKTKRKIAFVPFQCILGFRFYVF